MEEEFRPENPLPIENHPPSPALIEKEKFPKFQNHQSQQQQQPFEHFEVEDAKLKSGSAKPKPANPQFNPPLSGLIPPLQGPPDFDYPDLAKPLDPVKNIDFNSEGDLLGDSFPDFFKLRPKNVLEPDLAFMEELGKTKFELEPDHDHDHAKREQPKGHGELCYQIKMSLK